MLPEDERHGTHRGRYAHIRAGQEVCDACREAHNLYERRRRKSQALYGNKWKVDATGTRRRIQALYRLGWTGAHIAQAIGTNQARIDRIVNHQKHVHVRTAKAVAKVYDELSMNLGPSEHNRRIAKGKDWLPPLVWDDDTIDSKDASPKGMETKDRKFHKMRSEMDHAVIERFLNGDTYLQTSIAERREIVRRWRGPLSELEAIGWKPERYIDRTDGAA